jgi:hypothetical protein
MARAMARVARESPPRRCGAWSLEETCTFMKLLDQRRGRSCVAPPRCADQSLVWEGPAFSWIGMLDITRLASSRRSRHYGKAIYLCSLCSHAPESDLARRISQAMEDVSVHICTE